MVFSIGSITKSFVAALCLQLAEEEVFHLNDSIHFWLPEYQNIDGSVTIRQLLNNTSGIYNISDNKKLWDRVFEDPAYTWSANEVLQLYVLEPYGNPGTDWFYSNTNFILLGEVIRKSTGTDVSFQLRNRFFEPLGLNHTYLAVEEQLPSSTAHGWFDIDGNGHADDMDDIPEAGIYSVLWTSAGIFSAASDLVQWCSALLRGNVLSEVLLKEMLYPAHTMQGTTEVRWGMGLFQIGSENSSGLELIGYTGRTFGYLSSMFYMPESGISIAVLINEDNPEFLDAVTTELLVAAIAENEK